MTAFTFNSKYDDKMQLYGKDWSVPNTKVVILLIPGFGDHCERYQYLTSFFNEHNIAVVGIDLRGQGRSSGERGYTPNIKAYFGDVTSGIEEVSKRYPGVPLFMYGDSIGAAILCMYTNERYVDPLPYKAFIACTPSVIFPKKPGSVHLALVRAYGFLGPHTRAPVAGANYTYTNNPESIQARESDQYFHDRWPGHTIAILCECGIYFERNVCHFSIPTLIQHGSKAFLPMEKMRDFIRKSGGNITKPTGNITKPTENITKPSGNITFKEWEGFYAELHNDLRRTELFEYTLAWIEEQLKLFKNTQAS